MSNNYNQKVADKYSSIILSYKNKNPLLTNQKLALLIAKDGKIPLDKNVIRQAIPYVKKHTPEPFTMEDNYTIDIPESDYIERPPYVLPKQCNNILVLSDLHIPYHAIEPIRKAVQYGKDKQVNTILLNGDIMDCFQMSRFVRNPKNASMDLEINSTKQFLKFIRQQFPSAEIIYKQGNHELRFYYYVYLNAPALSGVLDFDNLLELKELRIKLVDAFTRIEAGHLNIVHGHEIPGMGINNARNKRLKAFDNILYSHHHQTQEDIAKTIQDKIIGSWGTGCLCGLSPDYAPVNSWNWGFSRVVMDGNFFQVENKKIILGNIL